jgi:hypothetical protein
MSSRSYNTFRRRSNTGPGAVAWTGRRPLKGMTLRLASPRLINALIRSGEWELGTDPIVWEKAPWE